MCRSERVGQERRRHVRVRPAADYDLKVECLEANGAPLMVVDVSLSGFGFLLDTVSAEWKAGQKLNVMIELPSGPPVAAELTIRHTAGIPNGAAGGELTTLNDATRSNLRRYVGVLFGRGLSA